MPDWLADPRPDLADAARWRDLLTAYYVRYGDDEGLGLLFGLRCFEVRLQPRGTKSRFQKPENPENQKEYDELKELLTAPANARYLQQITTALRYTP